METNNVIETVHVRVYCPICSHTVNADAWRAEVDGREAMEVIKGQKCARCSARLDAASIVDVLEATPNQEFTERAPEAAPPRRSKRRKRIAA